MDVTELILLKPTSPFVPSCFGNTECPHDLSLYSSLSSSYSCFCRFIIPLRVYSPVLFACLSVSSVRFLEYSSISFLAWLHSALGLKYLIWLAFVYWRFKWLEWTVFPQRIGIDMQGRHRGLILGDIQECAHFRLTFKYWLILSELGTFILTQVGPYQTDVGERWIL